MIKLALHGFLGRPDDWHSAGVEALDYTNIPQLGPKVSLQQWGRAFADYVAKRYPNQKVWLQGYSMGGRLALHALREQPKLWLGADLFSVNPGLSNEFDRQQRQHSDQIWAEKFLSLPWSELLEEWNRQPVFRGEQEPQRVENNYQRQVLADCLTKWSLSQQDDFRPWIRKTDLNISWWAGAQDRKFTDLLERLEISPTQKKIIVPEAGHRLIFKAELKA